MKASEFDEKFDSSEDIIEHLDLSSAERKNQSQKRINVDIPVWMLEKLDLEAKKLGVNRQAMIKIWLSEKLKRV
jgi:hypothetical protein